MALAYSNIQLEIREISLKDRPKELYKASEKGTVPVLITSNNRVIDESLDIMLWALNNHPNQTWISEDQSQEMDMIDMNDTLFKKWLDRYKYYDRHLDHSKQYYREKCQDILSSYENQLNHSKYFIRSDISVADVAIFPFVRQFANVDYDWFKTNYNKLRVWLEQICKSDLFTSIMNKYDTWNNLDQPIIINK